MAAFVGMFVFAGSAFAAQITVGNSTSLSGSAITDTRSDFAIVDVNSPANASEHLTVFSYYAANTNPFYFFVVDGGMVVKWVSDEITPSAIGVNTYTPSIAVPVQSGWNVGMYFVSTGTIPFDWVGDTATYTSAGYGVPVVDSTLIPDGTSGRTYYFVASGFSCEPTGFYRDSINMTAALINPTGIVSGDINATGCNVGIYYGPSQTGVIDGANIYGANYYGVVVRQAAVDVKNSQIHNIGENPFNGTQHGVGIYYTNIEGLVNGDCIGTGTTSGTVDSNTITQYQKGGIVVSCPNTNVAVTNNKVLGLSPVPYIAQNGIQFGYGASGEASGNEITGNWYQGASWTSTGLLLFDVNAKDVKKSNNKFTDNQTNLSVTTQQACPHMYGGVYEG